MRNKIYVLSMMISSCFLMVACNKSTADELHPNMPTGGRPCYPSTQCTGDPNLIGPGSQNIGVGCPTQGTSTNYTGAEQQRMTNMAPPQGMGGAMGAPSSKEGYSAPTGKVLQTESSEKFAGTIKSINQVDLPDQKQVQLILTTDRGDLLVVIGPATYLDQQKIRFAAGDTITILGYRVRGNGNDVIIAAEIQKDGNFVKLLDEKRQPLWMQNYRGGANYQSFGNRNRWGFQNYQWYWGQKNKAQNYQSGGQNYQPQRNPSQNYRNY